MLKGSKLTLRTFIPEGGMTPYAVGTVRTYVEHVSRLAQHFQRSPEDLTEEDVRSYLVYLVGELELQFVIKGASGFIGARGQSLANRLFLVALKTHTLVHSSIGQSFLRNGKMALDVANVVADASRAWIAPGGYWSSVHVPDKSQLVAILELRRE